MSVTPPPTYSNAQLPPTHNDPESSTAFARSTVVADLKSALEDVSASVGLPSVVRSEQANQEQQEKHDEEAREGWRQEGLVQKDVNIEQPVLVNVFNYTGTDFGKNESYDHSDLLPSFPKVSYPPLEPFVHHDPGHDADAKKARFYAEVAAQGGKVKHLAPAIGTEVSGTSLKKLSKEARDDLALLVAERGVVFFRDQADLDIDSQLDLGRHYGPLHVHATTGVPKRGDLNEVHVVYADSSARPDPSAFAKSELYHSDVTYEVQPPGATILKGVTIPDIGGDTIFTSCSALYSTLSPYYQKYLESLEAVHSGVEQAKGARGAGQHVRREPIQTLHPVVRVHPVTGVKSVFVNAGFVRRIVGVSKAESDNTLNFLYSEFASNPDLSTRFKWEQNDVAIWDNRVVNHSAMFDFWPARRHGVRVTPAAERPLSVAAYEAQYGKPAKDWAIERCKALGVAPLKIDAGLNKGERGFKD